MKRKKLYLKPDVKVHQVKPAAILAGSGNTQQLQNGATIGDDDWESES